MISARTEAELQSHAVEFTDYVRFCAWERGARSVQREWFHFVVRTPEAELVVNFCLVQRRSLGGSTTGSVLVLLRARDGGEVRWDGDLDVHDIDASHVGAGRIRLRMGDCSLDYDGGFRLRARCRRRGLSVDLALTPRCYPCVVQNVAVGDGSTLHWVVTPRLAATGEVRWGGRVLRVSDAPAYHDHNWGTFGDTDLAWEWGCSLDDARGGEAPVSVVFVRVLDRLRAHVVAQGVLVWEGAHRRREMRGDEVTFAAEGWLRPAHAPRVPRALSLLAMGAATDVPARLQMRARTARDVLDGEFVSEDVARVLVPRDTDLGTTIVHEVVGRLRLEGSLGGRPLRMDAPAFCEFLGDAG